MSGRTRFTIPAPIPVPEDCPRFYAPCRATIDNVVAPCPRYAGPLSNYVCERCETRIVGAMGSTLAQRGRFDTLQELKKAFDNRRWSPYHLRMEVTA